MTDSKRGSARIMAGGKQITGKASPNTTTDLADWLQRQLDQSGMTRMALAEKIGVTRGTVSRWMAPVENTETYRRPSTDNFISLGKLFGVDPVDLMNMTGLENTDGMSSIKRNTIAAVSMLPDHMLETLYPQVRALLDFHKREQLPKEIAERRKQKANDGKR